MTVAASDALTDRLSGNDCRRPTFSRLTALKSPTTKLSLYLQKQPSARTGESVSPVIDPIPLVTHDVPAVLSSLTPHSGGRVTTSRHGDVGTLCRVADAMLSRLFVCSFSPESRSGPFGPKPLFGLLVFGLDLTSPAISDGNDHTTCYIYICRAPVLQKGNPTMVQDTCHRIAGNSSTVTNGPQDIFPRNGCNNALLHGDASRVLVQCLLIAARRGRQIYLTREQAARLPPSRPTTSCGGNTPDKRFIDVARSNRCVLQCA